MDNWYNEIVIAPNRENIQDKQKIIRNIRLCHIKKARLINSLVHCGYWRYKKLKRYSFSYLCPLSPQQNCLIISSGFQIGLGEKN